MKSVNIINPLYDGFPTPNNNGGYWVPRGNFSPNCLIEVDRNVFHQTPKMRGEAYTAKQHHKEELRRYYGENWKRHLNVPEKSLSIPIRHSF